MIGERVIGIYVVAGRYTINVHWPIGVGWKSYRGSRCWYLACPIASIANWGAADWTLPTFAVGLLRR